jgi:hypothetical protein
MQATLTFFYPDGGTVVATATVDVLKDETTVFTLDPSARFTAGRVSSFSVKCVDADGIILGWSPTSSRYQYREVQDTTEGMLILGPIPPCPKIDSMLITMNYVTACPTTAGRPRTGYSPLPSAVPPRFPAAAASGTPQEHR